VQKFDIEIYNLKGLNDVEVRESPTFEKGVNANKCSEGLGFCHLYVHSPLIFYEKLHSGILHDLQMVCSVLST
jgi:hypothetical protein